MKAKRVIVEWILGEFWVIWKEMKGNERKWKQNWLNEFWVNFGWYERKWKEMNVNESKTGWMNFGWILGEFWVIWKEMKGNERKWKHNWLNEFWVNFGWYERKWKEMKAKLVEWILGAFWVNFEWYERKWKEMKAKLVEWILGEFWVIWNEMKGNFGRTQRKWQDITRARHQVDVMYPLYFRTFVHQAHNGGMKGSVSLHFCLLQIANLEEVFFA